MKKLIIILLAGAVAAGCSPYDIDEILLERSDMSMTMKGKEIYSFNPDDAQISVNALRGEYRMFDDDLGNWVKVVWDERPTGEGQKIRMDVSWKIKKNPKDMEGLEFEVMRTDGSGMIWLWNSSEKIGITIKDF